MLWFSDIRTNVIHQSLHYHKHLPHLAMKILSLSPSLEGHTGASQDNLQ